MDRVLFNEAYNRLKQVIGKNGAFILFIDTGGLDENAVAFHTMGTMTRVQGLLMLGTQHTDGIIKERAKQLFQKLPPEPD